MKKLRIAVYPADGGGCGSYRLIWPAAAVKERFSDQVEILTHTEAPLIKIRWDQRWKDHYDMVPSWVNVVDAWVDEPIDIAIFQRPSGHEYPKVVQCLRERGVTVIIDLDDNFDRIDPRNAAWFGSEPYWHSKDRVQQYVKKYGRVHIDKASYNEEYFYIPEYEGRYSRRYIHETLKNVTLLTASTPHIANHYRNSPKGTVVLENLIPKRYLDIGRETEEDKVVVGWTGTLATHPYDFKPVGAGISLARSKTDFKWRIIGDGIGILEKTGLAPDDSSGWVDLEDYPRYFATLDVAVCPLEDQQFNYSKSWLKPLEAAALGVVPVISPLPEYTKINERGIGLIAKRPKDWEKHIVRLVNDHEYRREKAAEGKEIASQMTIEGNAEQWLNAWVSAYEMDH